MTAEAETDFSLMPREQRLANIWIGAWCLIAALCTPTLADGLINRGEVSTLTCLFALVVIWLIPLLSTTAVHGPHLVDRALRSRSPRLREQVNMGLVVGSVALGVLTILPALAFVCALAVELVWSWL